MSENENQSESATANKDKAVARGKVRIDDSADEHKFTSFSSWN